MTIAQHFLGKKTSKPLEEPLVPGGDKSGNLKDVEEGRPVVVTMHTHVRRVNSLTTLCVFASALLVLTTGIIGGMYLFRQFAHYKLRHFHGWCSIPYPSVQNEPNHKSNVQDKISAMFEGLQTYSPPKANFFEEEFDIDIKFEQYETVEVPAFGNRRHGKFVHDFTVNKTAIVDPKNRRCFLMILDRSYVWQPRLLYEEISKMRAGYYDADTQTIRHNMRVLTPPVSDLKNVGFYITRDCASMPIYKLENFHSLAYKRSINEDKDNNNVFVEFAGNKVNEFKIINIEDAVSGESPSETS